MARKKSAGWGWYSLSGPMCSRRGRGRGKERERDTSPNHGIGLQETRRQRGIVGLEKLPGVEGKAGSWLPYVPANHTQAGSLRDTDLALPLSPAWLQSCCEHAFVLLCGALPGSVDLSPPHSPPQPVSRGFSIATHWGLAEKMPLPLPQDTDTDWLQIPPPPSVLLINARLCADAGGGGECLCRLSQASVP